MSWRAVARREVVDLRRSRGIWAVVGLSTGVGVAAVLLPALAIERSFGADLAVRFLATPLKLALGLTGLLVGYGAVAGPRSGGQLKLIMGLPIRRSGLVLGAFFGRLAIVLGGTVLVLAMTAAAVLFVHGTLPWRTLAGFGLLLGLFAGSITGFAVGVSAASPTRWFAATTVVGAFVLFQFFWGLVPSGVHYVIEGSLPGTTVPAWVVLLERLQPFAAFDWATDLVLPEAERTIRLSRGGADAASGDAASNADRLAGGRPGYLHPWGGVVILFGWALGPLLVGVRRFSRADLS